MGNSNCWYRNDDEKEKVKLKHLKLLIKLLVLSRKNKVLLIKTLINKMKTLIYPIFLSVRELTQDYFWRLVFENLAYGETPKGVFFKDDLLYSTYKKKEFNYLITNKTSNQIYTDLLEIFSNRIGLKSKSDLSKKRETFIKFCEDNSIRQTDDIWSKLKKKSLKENLIQNFVLEIQNKFDLSLEETKKLYFYISVGLTFKMFSSSDIIMKNGDITEIESINIVDKKIIVEREFSEPSIKRVEITSLLLLEEFQKFLKKM